MSKQIEILTGFIIYKVLISSSESEFLLVYDTSNDIYSPGPVT